MKNVITYMAIGILFTYAFYPSGLKAQHLVPYPTDGIFHICADSSQVNLPLYFYLDTIYDPVSQFNWQFSPKNEENWTDIHPDNTGNISAHYDTLRFHYAAPLFDYKFRCLIFDRFTGSTIDTTSVLNVPMVDAPVVEFSFETLDGNPSDYLCANEPFNIVNLSHANTDVDPGNELARYEWSVIDGNQFSVFSVFEESQYILTQAGQHQFRLKVWDRWGCSSQKPATLEIYEQEILHIAGRAVVCNNHAMTYEVGLPQSLDPDKLTIIWEFDEPIASLPIDSIHQYGDYGERLMIWFKMNDPDISTHQIALNTRITSEEVFCEVASASKQILFTAKHAPADDVVQSLVLKNTDLVSWDQMGGLIITLMNDDAVNYHFRWGMNEEEPEEGFDQHIFYPFDPNNNHYWLELKRSDHEACWKRFYLEYSQSNDE